MREEGNKGKEEKRKDNLRRIKDEDKQQRSDVKIKGIGIMPEF